MLVMVMNGPAEAGKDTFIDYLEKIFDLFICRYSSIDWVKQIAVKEFSWDGKKDTKGRNLLSALKMAAVDYNDMPLEMVKSRMLDAVVGDHDIFVVDIREPDEIEKFVKYCRLSKVDCVTIRIWNIVAEEKALASGLSLSGDRLFGEYDYDYGIPNNGTLEDLESHAREFGRKLFS